MRFEGRTLSLLDGFPVVYIAEDGNLRENLLIIGIPAFPNITIPLVIKLKP